MVECSHIGKAKRLPGIGGGGGTYIQEASVGWERGGHDIWQLGHLLDEGKGWVQGISRPGNMWGMPSCSLSTW